MDSETAIVKPDDRELEASGKSLLARAKALVIKTPEDYELSATYQEKCVKHKTMIDALYDEGREKAHGLWKWFTGRIALLSADPDEARKLLDAKRRDYRNEQERIRQEQESRLRAEAAKAEAERRRAEEDERMRIAADLEAAGEADTAAMLIDEHVNAPPPPPAPLPVVATIVPKQQGRAIQTTWGWELVDVTKLDRRWLVPNDKAINANVRALGPQCGIDGIKVFPVERESVRVA